MSGEKPHGCWADTGCKSFKVNFVFPYPSPHLRSPLGCQGSPIPFLPLHLDSGWRGLLPGIFLWSILLGEAQPLISELLLPFSTLTPSLEYKSYLFPWAGKPYPETTSHANLRKRLKKKKKEKKKAWGWGSSGRENCILICDQESWGPWSEWACNSLIRKLRPREGCGISKDKQWRSATARTNEGLPRPHCSLWPKSKTDCFHACGRCSTFWIPALYQLCEDAMDQTQPLPPGGTTDWGIILQTKQGTTFAHTFICMDSFISYNPAGQVVSNKYYYYYSSY